jgi:hypothetical protein
MNFGCIWELSKIYTAAVHFFDSDKIGNVLSGFV